MNKLKRTIIFLEILITIGLTSSKAKNKKIFEIIDEPESAFASYEDGFIYIGDKEFISKININNGDVLVLDDRKNKDPNMQIKDSYKITNPLARKNIIKALIEYEKRYPSSWKRSEETMYLEWIIHNISYYFNYQRERTRNVDFNNADEKVYKRN